MCLLQTIERTIFEADSHLSDAVRGLKEKCQPHLSCCLQPPSVWFPWFPISVMCSGPCFSDMLALVALHVKATNKAISEHALVCTSFSCKLIFLLSPHISLYYAVGMQHSPAGYLVTIQLP